MTTLCVINLINLVQTIVVGRFTMTDLTAEVTELKTSVSELKKNLKKCPKDVQNQLKTFAQVK